MCRLWFIGPPNEPWTQKTNGRGSPGNLSPSLGQCSARSSNLTLDSHMMRAKHRSEIAALVLLRKWPGRYLLKIAWRYENKPFPTFWVLCGQDWCQFHCSPCIPHSSQDRYAVNGYLMNTVSGMKEWMSQLIIYVLSVSKMLQEIIKCRWHLPTSLE